MIAAPLVLQLVIATATAATPTVEGAVRASFERYKKASLARDGAAAAAELDANTIAYYASLRTAALSAPDIHKLPPNDKMLILRLRMELSPDQLSALDGRSLIAYMIGRRWVDLNQVRTMTLGKITVEGGTAHAETLAGGKPAGGQLVYRHEKKDWKLDLAANNVAMHQAFGVLRERRKVSEDELVQELVRDATGVPVPAKAWQPLAPARPR